MEKKKQSTQERHFCGECGSHLWAFNNKWPDYIYPLPNSIDTPLPIPPQKNHFMLEFKANWVAVPPADENNLHFNKYPDCGIEDWHKKHGLYDKC